jgi:outer membrane lipoprotein-sorting protein
LNILRRLPLSRLLLLCAVVIGVGVSATAIAFAVGSGPVPKPKPLAEAVHDALAAPSVEGASANIVWTNHLLEGANLAGTGVQGAGGELLSSPLITGASGRLWVAKDGHVRLELQSENGDTEVISDGHTLQVYDASSNTLYRYTPPAHEASSPPPAGPAEPASPDAHEVPSLAKVQEAISHLEQHWDVSGATPTDVAGQPAYTLRVSPKEGGSLLAGLELSWDSNNGVPLRAAVYSTESTAPVMELAASEVSFGPVESSVFSFTPPASAKVEEVHFGNGSGTSGSGATGSSGASDTEKPTLTTHGQGPSTIAVLETKTKPGETTSSTLEQLPKVTISGTKASELKTELGTLLTFVRSGVRYVVAGAVPTAGVEEVARGL